jgi:hypothetical protein
MWRPYPWRVGSNAVAIRNARTASLILARRRQEREEVDVFLAAMARRFEQPLGA